jgi:hypothetical protein
VLAQFEILEEGDYFDPSMGWAFPKYKKHEINKAASILTGHDSDVDLEKAFEIIGNWRSSHKSPLNTFQNSFFTSAGFAAI